MSNWTEAGGHTMKSFEIHLMSCDGVVDEAWCRGHVESATFLAAVQEEIDANGGPPHLKLVIVGDPHYRLWRYRPDDPGYYVEANSPGPGAFKVTNVELAWVKP
jgi:hypothetical protein